MVALVPSEQFPLDIAALEKGLLSLPQAECGVFHHFSPGIYIRGVHLPAGIFAIGHFQKGQHLNIMVRGKVIMVNVDETTSVLTGPQIFLGEPGKKAGYVLEDTLWLNVYPTDETDVEKLEEMFVDKSSAFMQTSEEEDAAAFHAASRADFQLLLAELCTELAEWISPGEASADLVGLSKYSTHILVLRKSPIAGLGLFLSAGISKGAVIGAAIVDGLRTPLMRYVNHSIKPNAEFIEVEGNLYLVAMEGIEGCKGGSPGTEITVNYRNALSIQGTSYKETI